MSRRTVGVALVALAVVAVLVGSIAWYRYAHRQVLVVVDAACPPLVMNTRNSTDDYGDVVEWHGQSLWRTDQSTRGGEQVGVVGCSIGSMPNPDGLRVAQLPWPDGTATGLPRGTTLHVPTEERTGVALVARTPQGDVLYCPDVENGPPAC